jgi:putative transposase
VRTLLGAKGAVLVIMRYPLKRIYGVGHLHFVTCSCYRRLPLLGTAQARDTFLKVLNDVRKKYDLGLIGYTAMPEHIHLLLSEPNIGTISTVMQVLKQRVSRALKARRRTQAGQLRLWHEGARLKREPFWQRRFYDFNVWSDKKKWEKLNYIHFNAVKRGLVKHPKDWKWSSFGFYSLGKANECPPNPGWVAKPARRVDREGYLAHPSRLA